jgi:hypothetical protein
MYGTLLSENESSNRVKFPKTLGTAVGSTANGSASKPGTMLRKPALLSMYVRDSILSNEQAQSFELQCLELSARIFRWQ